MTKARLGVALLLPAGVSAEVDGLRRALGDGALGRIPAHLTLVPPVNVREDRLGHALAVLRSAAAAVVGRGGLPVDLVVSDGADAEAAALAGAGRPFCVTARRDGAVVGVATGWTAGAEASLHCLVVAHGARREGVGSHLLAAVGSVAADRGCSAVVACVGAGGPGEAFLHHKGWVTDGPRLRREL